MDELIKSTAETIFNDFEKWKAFQQLRNYENGIKNYYIKKAKDQINIQINKIKNDYISSNWIFREDTSSSISFVCHPIKIKNHEISFWFEDNKFSFWVNVSQFNKEKLQEKLLSNKYQLENLFKGNCKNDLDKIDAVYKITEEGYFFFEKPDDYSYDFQSLNWFMGNESEKFAKQLLEKFQSVMTLNIESLILDLYNEKLISQ